MTTSSSSSHDAAQQVSETQASGASLACAVARPEQHSALLQQALVVVAQAVAWLQQAAVLSQQPADFSQQAVDASQAAVVFVQHAVAWWQPAPAVSQPAVDFAQPCEDLLQQAAVATVCKGHTPAPMRRGRRRTSGITRGHGRGRLALARRLATASRGCVLVDGQRADQLTTGVHTEAEDKASGVLLVHVLGRFVGCRGAGGRRAIGHRRARGGARLGGQAAGLVGAGRLLLGGGLLRTVGADARLLVGAESAGSAMSTAVRVSSTRRIVFLREFVKRQSSLGGRTAGEKGIETAGHGQRQSRASGKSAGISTHHRSPGAIAALVACSQWAV